MDLLSVVLTLIVVVALGGSAAYGLRSLGWDVGPRRRRPAAIAASAGNAELPLELERVRADLRAARGEQEDGLTRVRAELRAAVGQQEAALASVRQQLDAEGDRLERSVHRAVAEAGREAQGRQDAETARMRAELRAELRALALEAVGPSRSLREGRAETLIELYKRLAKLEWTIAAVTHPIQLPGEAYAVPDEFLPETLRWEAWKEVGDAAFAFADYFNQHELHLDEGAARELAAFIATLRGALTRSIYPNLQPNPGPERLDALRSGLERIGAGLPAVRALLAREYRELAGIGEGGG